jgi:dTMP kinase
LPIELGPQERRTLDDVAREHVLYVLGVCRNNRRNAARVLGIDRKTLSRNLARWGVTLPREAVRLRPGSLIAVEGIDGSGIPTQATRLVALLNANGHTAIYTDEPSRGRVGHLIRDLLGTYGDADRKAALRVLSLLFAADRVDHFQRVVAPALAQGVTVVSDRWYHSSLAYQRTGVERDWISGLNRYTRTPDVTVFLDVRAEVAQRRREAAGRTQEFFHDGAMQRDAVAGYRATIAELRLEGERIEVVNGEDSVEGVTAAILHELALDALSTG